MKRVKLTLLTAFLVLSLCACNGAKDSTNELTATPQTEVITDNGESADTDKTTEENAEKENPSDINSEDTGAENTENAGTENTETDKAGAENTGTENLEDQEKETAMEENNKELEEQKAAEEAERKYNYMLGSSILTTGNNYRFKQFMNKVRNGEHVNIVTLGGSITEGGNAKPMSEGYAYKFADAFVEKYGADATFVNAGLSGTPSALGVMRYEKDVLAPLEGGTPDLLFIEFAVNDWQEATGGRALESLIYQALTDNPDCAVILIFTVTNKDWTLQKDMMPYGYYYKLPMISMQNALKNAAITPEEYFNDEFHPSNKGHIVMRDCIMTMIEKLDTEETAEPFELPEEVKKGREFMHMKLITDGAADVEISRGAFSEKDSEIQSFQVKKVPSFPDNFMHVAGSNEPLVMKLNCSTILLDYKTSSNSAFGEAVVLVDGQEVTNLNGYSAGGWNNSNVVLVLDEQEPKEHTLEVRMADGQEDKKFTVLGVAVR